MSKEYLLIGLEKVHKKLLDTMPDLKVVGTNTTGLDHIDLEECKKRGIEVISLRGETEFLKDISSTAEHTIGLIIALLRNYKTALNEPYRDREKYKGNVLKSKTFGVIGFGRIGLQVANRIRLFGMDIIWYDKNKEWASFSFSDEHSISVMATRRSELSELLTQSDVISLHIPLDSNEGFFKKEMFQKMKATAYFVNTSRSKVVEEGTLLWALKQKKIAGAAVDFIDDPDLVAYAKDHDNLILTPHLGGCTYEDMQKTRQFIADKVEKYLENA